jgi:hypothetical protein
LVSRSHGAARGKSSGGVRHDRDHQPRNDNHIDVDDDHVHELDDRAARAR